MGPLLKFVQAPLDGIPSLRRLNCTTKIGIIFRLVEDALDAIVYVIDEDLKLYLSPYGPLKGTTCP